MSRAASDAWRDAQEAVGVDTGALMSVHVGGLHRASGGCNLEAILEVATALLRDNARERQGTRADAPRSWRPSRFRVRP